MEEDGAESEGQEFVHAVPMIERYGDEDSPGAKVNCCGSLYSLTCPLARVGARRLLGGHQ